MSVALPTQPAWRIGAEHLEVARRVVAQHAWLTPLVPAPSIHPRVWLKLDNHQHTGSFKVRGALTRLSVLSERERAMGVVAASAGNHGLGIAYASAKLGVSARVFVPAQTPTVKREGIRALGAEVVVGDMPGYDAAEEAARRAADATGAVFVSPYDDPWVAAGNGGTIGMEVLGAIPDVDAVVCPVGGGGLVCGVAAAREFLAAGGEDDRAGSAGSAVRPTLVRAASVQLVGVNAEVSPGMLRSFEVGRAVEALPPAETLAEGLEGGVRPTTFLLAREAAVRMEAVSEEAIADAMRWARDVLGTPVEGSGAAGLAWARRAAASLAGDGPIVVIVTGSNVDPVRLRQL